MTRRLLVVAKAPRAGRVKTRLGAEVGMAYAAEVAAAALLDTMDTCAAANRGARCHLALDGDLPAAVRGAELRDRARGWWVHPQRGDGLAERLVQAHLDLDHGPSVQVGMDTPQLTAGHLDEVAAGLDHADAVLGPAEDGGWWALGLRDPRAAVHLRGVPFSGPCAYDDTRAALAGAGLRVATASGLRDVDTAADARKVATECHGEFARVWSRGPWTATSGWPSPSGWPS